MTWLNDWGITDLLYEVRLRRTVYFGFREFRLDSSLHVLWNAARQRGEDVVPDKHLLKVKVDASSPETYVRPKSNPTYELLWAEREQRRYKSAKQKIRLPPGDYQASLILTEESFHASGNDGGYWATVFKLPVSFTVTQ